MAEENKFVIGGYTFDTYYEYRAALEDVQKIECINKELDVQNPEVAIRLYNDIKDGIITFNSPIGKAYVKHVGDIVANRSKGLLDDVSVIDEAEDKARSQRIIGLFCIAAAVVVFGLFAGYEIKDIRQTKHIKEMQAAVASVDKEKPAATVSSDNNKTEGSTSNKSHLTGDIPQLGYIDPANLTILPEYASLHEQYPEMVGWISIADTDINYPVVQRENDDEYYLDHAIDGTENANGTIFVDSRCDIVNPTTNTIIYGHNMKNGAMFGTIKKYLSADYLATHRMIQFDTIYEHRTYEIVAVGLSKVVYQDDEQYRYYDFINANTIDDLNLFINNVYDLSVFEDPINITNTDKLLTLSTCNSYTEDGRLFIVAKQVEL